MRLLICGSRNWTDRNIIEASFDMFKEGSIEILINGGARGADSIAESIAISRNIPVKKYKAEWEKFGKSAGYERNKQMLTEGKPDLVIGFIISNSKGTRNMLDLAENNGVPNLEIRGI